jgi:DNA-binding transcriptional regulator YiaG|tara:strand:+ start:3091 stop:3852 length:762 start_codon:yes stop_codon:yes gene_type:complete
MDQLNIVGIKEIGELAKKDEASKNLSLSVQNKNQEELKNLEEIAFEKPKAKTDVKPTLEDVEITNPIIKKRRGRPRGVSKRDPEKMKEHMRLMREKAKISKAKKREERLKRKEELEGLKLATKLGVSMETLLDYEQKRKQIQQANNHLDKQMNVAKNPPPQKQREVQKKNTEFDYNKLADIVYNKFRTEEQIRRENLLKKKEEEQEKIREQKEKEQAKLYQQNKRYYKRLGRPNLNRYKDDSDAWVSLFRKKR